jgi:hypothetical protein
MSVTLRAVGDGLDGFGDFFAAIIARDQADDLDPVAVSQHVEREARHRGGVGDPDVGVVDHAVGVHDGGRARFREKTARLIGGGALQ